MKVYHYPIRPDVIEQLNKIEDPWRRGLACCLIGIIGETVATRELLSSCLGADPLMDALISRRIGITALPLSRRKKPQPKKAWTPPNRVPSLLASEGEGTQRATLVDSEAAIYDASNVPDELGWANALAQATLSTEIVDLVVNNSGATSEFADLLVGLSDEDKKTLVDEWRPTTEPYLPEPSGNLFRKFGIEVPKAEAFDINSPESKARKTSARRRSVPVVSLFDVQGGDDE